MMLLISGVGIIVVGPGHTVIDTDALSAHMVVRDGRNVACEWCADPLLLVVKVVCSRGSRLLLLLVLICCGLVVAHIFAR